MPCRCARPPDPTRHSGHPDAHGGLGRLRADVRLSRHRPRLDAANIGPVQTSILVVDDDAGFRSLAVRMLRTTGFSVVGQAETCATAMDAALDLRPRAILVDVRLPDGNGIELARKLRA